MLFTTLENGYAVFGAISVWASSYDTGLAGTTPWAMPFSNNNFISDVYDPVNNPTSTHNYGVVGDYCAGGHMIVFIGWDGANFIVRNSWNKAWGNDGGHFRLPYEYVCGDSKTIYPGQIVPGTGTFNSTTNPSVLTGPNYNDTATSTEAATGSTNGYSPFSYPPYAGCLGLFPSTFGSCCAPGDAPAAPAPTPQVPAPSAPSAPSQPQQPQVP